MTPYFSIIIPVYNVGRYLNKCLDSIITQSFSDYELILVNDGSDDDSLDICRFYERKDKRIKVFDQINQGASAARNKGLIHASGNYVMFVDSDDWIDCDALAILYDNTQDNCPLVYHGFRSAFGKGDFKIDIHGFRQSQDKEDYYRILYHTMQNKMHSFIYGFTCNKLFRRDILEKYNIRFDTTLRVKEDELFTSQFCNVIEKVKIIPYAFYNYRISFGQSLSFVKRSPEEYENMADKLYDAVSSWKDNEIQHFQRQEYIFNLSKGITAAIRRREYRTALRLSIKVAGKMKTLKMHYRSFDRVGFKDRIRYRFSSALWVFLISIILGKFYSV